MQWVTAKYRSTCSENEEHKINPGDRILILETTVLCQECGEQAEQDLVEKAGEVKPKTTDKKRYNI
jgi:hypothetical protein